MSENNNKPKNNMPRFNLSWLYLFIAMTIAYLYFTGDDVVPGNLYRVRIIDQDLYDLIGEVVS